jgi:type I restriction enzyme M protein
MDFRALKLYFGNQKTKVVECYDFENKKVTYSNLIRGWKIDKFRGDEEIARAYLLAHLVNDLGYGCEYIEIEKQYDIGRPKVNKPRIDIIVRDDKGGAFLYIELKSPRDYEKNKDEVIEKQLFNLASQEKGQGKEVKYLVLYTIEIAGNEIKDRAMIIDYGKFENFDTWKTERNFTDQLPIRYGKPQKEPYIKGGKKDLQKKFVYEQLGYKRENLHNVLWGGGGTDDNDVFSSLVNIILAKIQDEIEKRNSEKYDFQIFSFKDGESFESNEQLFDRINNLYRRALKGLLNITDQTRLNKSYVIDENKFSLQKLKYAVSELEQFGFVEGKDSADGRDVLGDFFEGIIRDGFKQTKGQFFTHINIVRFMLWGLQLDKLAIDKVNNDAELPYCIDPSAGSGTFIIEYMKFITENLKRRFKDKISDSRTVRNKITQWFTPDSMENRWAAVYIYGNDINFNLGTAIKVNMILHGDGSTNIFTKDGLLPFSEYIGITVPNLLNKSEQDTGYSDIAGNGKEVNKNFDVVITNPPFSVDLDNDTKRKIRKEFLFGEKKNSENLFIERWYQLLRENGRMGVVLPESVFDTTENKYIRLFIYKYFKIKAIVSLPQLAFEPYTSTKTSLLFAQKKTKTEVDRWNELWNQYAKEWGLLSARCANLLDVYLHGKDRNKLPTIKDISMNEEKKVLLHLLKNYREDSDDDMQPRQLIEKYYEEIIELCKYDNDTKDVFGFCDTWWVFGEVVRELDYKIVMLEADNIGYKRTKRGERPMPNDLFRIGKNKEMLIDDGVKKAALDYLRLVEWD